MLNVACPACGERGKIPATLRAPGSNAKNAARRSMCRASGEAPLPLPPRSQPAPAESCAGTVTPAHEGIAVEGLDARRLEPRPGLSRCTFRPSGRPNTRRRPCRGGRSCRSCRGGRSCRSGRSCRVAAPAAFSEAFTVHHDGHVQGVQSSSRRATSFSKESSTSSGLKKCSINWCAAGLDRQIDVPAAPQELPGRLEEELVVLLER